MDPQKPPSGSEDGYLPSVSLHLGETNKELGCLFGISDIVENAGGSLDRIFQETCEWLPRSWTPTEVAGARISLWDEEFRSRGFEPAPLTLASELRVHGNPVGSIELVHLGPHPAEEAGPFSEGERRLLHYVAERLGHVVERLTADERLRKKEEEFRERITHVTRISTMGEMASGIAHEVNQPLTAVATYAQACRRMVAGGMLEASEVLEVLEEIGHEAQRAGDIIHRLRGMVRRHERELVEENINHLMEEIAPLASVDARLNEVDLEVILAPRPRKILADGVQIQQVVLNLIRNGIDAMEGTPPDERKLKVQVRAPDDNSVEVWVSDRGCGLPDESEKTLFEPFFTTKETGLGLGLSISRSIISAHGGKFSFSRNPEGGTTFWFSLPTVSEPEDE